MNDTIRYGRFLDIPDRRGSGYEFYSSSGLDRYHGHHRYHPYRRSERGYFPDELKKSNPPTFNGELNKMEGTKAWLLGMKKLFELHDYIENTKVRIAIFSLKGKIDIWWEDVKLVRDIRIKELSLHEFKRLFRNKYLLDRYYVGKAKEFYDWKMGSVTDEEYMNKLVELLRYVPYVKDEKTKFQRFISGIPLAFKYYIEYDEPQSLEEVITKLK